MKRFLAILFLVLFFTHPGHCIILPLITTAAGGCTGVVGNNGSFSDFNAKSNGDILVRKITISESCSSPATYDLYAFINYINLDSREIIYVIYSDSGGEPDSLLQSTAAYWDSGVTSAQWVSRQLTTSLSTGDYWIGVQIESSTTRLYHSTGSATIKRLNATFGSPPSTWDTGSDSDETDNLLFYLDFGS